jgi:hypothetical protein
MLIGCADCNSSALCDFKVLTTVILPAAEPDDTGSYCPHTYNCSDGCVTECSAVYNMVQWLLAQWDAFHVDTNTAPSGSTPTGYPWNTYTAAVFTDSTSTGPTTITGPGSSGTYGGTSYGSNYAAAYPLVAEYGSAAGGLCAIAQIVAFKMTGNLFISPSDVSGVTESCLESGGGPCIPGAPGARGQGAYYIPLPPYDLCAEIFVPGSGFDIAYAPYQTGNNEYCLPAYPGGAYTTCLSPDPFFGSDPP